MICLSNFVDTCCDQQQIQNFGDPFFLAIREGETLAEVKGRIQRKLQVSDEEFSKVILIFSFIDGIIELLFFPILI
jgi:ubiquitin carboxyl-terminal hydrolase 7